MTKNCGGSNGTMSWFANINPVYGVWAMLTSNIANRPLRAHKRRQLKIRGDIQDGAGRQINYSTSQVTVFRDTLWAPNYLCISYFGQLEVQTLST